MCGIMNLTCNTVDRIFFIDIDKLSNNIKHSITLLFNSGTKFVVEWWMQRWLCKFKAVKVMYKLSPPLHVHLW